MTPTASFAGHNAGFQVGQNTGQIHNYFNQTDDSKATNPELDKKRIEEEKGGLLQDSYRWVLNHEDFQRWRDVPDGQLLWIKGDPGKGKTMLICGIIDELSKTIEDNINIAYFFCQANNSRINSATAVLRGLIYMLGKQQPSLYTYIPTRFLDNENGWFELCDVFRDILKDSAIRSTYLIIDALDECTIDQERLLRFLKEHSSSHPRVKWIVSSRNWPSIEKYLDSTTGIRLQLELNEHNLSAAVDLFVKYKVDELSKRNKYRMEKRKIVKDHLTANAKGTFLWVALVCKQLENVPERHLQKKLKEFPPGLDEFYQRMFCIISSLNDDAELCMSLLGIITTVYRPITLDELLSYLKSQDEITGDGELQDIVRLCGSFLVLRERTISLVHQSAQDFLLNRVSQKIYPNGAQEIHYSIFSQSLQALHTTLRRDIYNLGDPAFPMSQVKPPDPDPLATVRYACVYWVDHLYNYFRSKENEPLEDATLLEDFLCQDLVYWLEALSLSRSLSEGAVLMLKLEGLLKTRTQNKQLTDRVQDAYRFILYHKAMIEKYPLQVHSSALVFSPRSSITRNQYEQPDWIIGIANLEESWGACLQTLEGHNGSVNSVVFSPDSQRLASASSDETVKVWDTSSGQCLHTLEGYNSSVNSVVFSPDSQQLTSTSFDETVKVWDASSGQCLHTLEGHNGLVSSVVFSPDSQRLASASDDETVKVWDSSSGQCLNTLEGHNGSVISVVFSPDSQWLASASGDETVKVWDTSSGQCLHTLEGHNGWVSSVVFSPDSQWLASASSDETVKVWDTSNGQCLHTLEGHNGWVSSVVFSPNSQRLASASFDKTVKVWDASSGQCLHSLEGHNGSFRSVVFSPDSQRLASASDDETVKVWDTSSGQCLHTLEGHNGSVSSVVFSPDSQRLASASSDQTVKVWDASSGQCLHILEGHNGSVYSVVFSPDSQQLASASYDETAKVWDSSSGQCLHTLDGSGIISIKFDVMNSYLETNRGRIRLSLHSGSIPSEADPEALCSQGIGISSDSTWITWNSANLLRLPSVYEISTYAVAQSCVCIGNASGRVLILNFNCEKLVLAGK